MRLFLFLALISSSVLAGEFASRNLSFHYSGHNNGQISIYSCQSAEAMAESHLESLGAVNARIDCTGGLEQWGLPVHLSGTFEVVVPQAGDTTEVVTLKSRSYEQNCDFNVRFLENVLPQFPGVKVLQKRANCFDNRSRWSYKVEVTR